MCILDVWTKMVESINIYKGAVQYKITLHICIYIYKTSIKFKYAISIMKTKFMILYIDICTYIDIIYPMNLSI